MNRPLLLAVPLLMLLDYLLTIAGARLHGTGYARHFRVEHYELNPLWQESVAKKRWFEPRHLAVVALITLAIVAADQLLFGAAPDFGDFFLGALLTVFTGINARHLANIAIFWYVARHPQSLSGEVRMTHTLVLWMSAAQTLVLLLPLAVVAAATRTGFTLGAFFGAAVLSLVHLLWLRRARSARQPPQAQRDGGA